MKSEQKRNAGWGAVCALSIWLGFPNDILPLPFLALFWPVALVFLGMGAATWQRAIRMGWLTGFAGSLAALYWLCLPVAQVGGLPWPVAFMCAALIAFALSAQSGIFAFAAFGVKNFCAWRRAFLLGLLWYFLEYAFAVAPGFPWLPLAGALAQWPLFIQGADMVGAYLLGALWFASVLLCFGQCLRPRIAGIALMAILTAYGAWRMKETPVDLWPQGSETMGALMVEGNVDQNRKWVPAFQKDTLSLYLRLTSDGLQATETFFDAERPLIIWPETAMPFFYERSPMLAKELADSVKELDCPLLFGAPGVEKSGDSKKDAMFNRAFLLGPDGNILSHYDKKHLVPFGEYTPAWLKLDFLEPLLQGVGIYSEGNSAKPLAYDNLALGLLICYEGIFPWLAQERVAAGANLLVDISNDGWFGQTPAARQHLYLTALRCVEQGRWLLRATNTGLSAVVDSRGRVLLTGPMFKAGFLPCRARLLEMRTVYYYLADWLPFLALAVFCGILATGRAARRKA